MELKFMELKFHLNFMELIKTKKKKKKKNCMKTLL